MVAATATVLSGHVCEVSGADGQSELDVECSILSGGSWIGLARYALRGSHARDVTGQRILCRLVDGGHLACAELVDSAEAGDSVKAPPTLVAIAPPPAAEVARPHRKLLASACARVPRQESEAEVGLSTPGGPVNMVEDDSAQRGVRAKTCA